MNQTASYRTKYNSKTSSGTSVQSQPLTCASQTLLACVQCVHISQTHEACVQCVHISQTLEACVQCVHISQTPEACVQCVC